MIAGIQGLIADGQVEEVPIDQVRVSSDLAMAQQHLLTAQSAVQTDPVGSFQLAYDSARKALQAVLASQGLRVKHPPHGNHYTFVLVSRSDLVDSEIWRPLNWLREQRNEFQYEASKPDLGADEDARQAIAHVTKMLLNAKEVIEGSESRST